MISYSMEILEMIRWTLLGFIPTYAGLEIGSRKLARRMSTKPLLTARGKQ
jgi:hypothetical protein